MTSRMTRLAVALALLSAAFNLFQQFQSLQSLWPVVARWSDPTAQARMVASADGAPYDLLRAADDVLPRDAVVLLVTSGRDVRHREYTTFHRALYWLAPRAVWWLAPVPPDGTWESRWWMAAPLNTESVLAFAREKHATHVLAGDFTPSFDIGQKIFQSDEGALYQLDEVPTSPQSRLTRDERPSPIGSGSADSLWLIQLGAALIVIWLLGDLPLTLIARAGYHARGVERVALAWVFGVGVITLGMLWLNAMGLALTQQIIVLTAVAAAGVVLSQNVRSIAPRGRRMGNPTRARRYATRGAVPLVMFTILFLQIALVAVTAIGAPLRFWDSWVTWGMKARTIFVESAITPSVYLDASRAVTHLDYPLLVPLGEAWLYGWLGAADDRMVGALSLSFYLALSAIGYATIRRWGGAMREALLTATLIATCAPIAHAAGGAFADVPLAVLAVVAVVYLVHWLEGSQPAALIVAALAAGLMPWTKREGWLLVGAICLALLTVSRKRRVWRGACALAFSALVLAGPWYAFIALHDISNTDFLPITMATFLENLNRVPFIVWRVLLSLIGPDWNFVWAFSMALAAYRWAGAKHSSMKQDRDVIGKTNASPLLVTTALIYLIAISLSYMFSSHVPYQQHVISSLDRLIAQVAPLVVLWLARRTFIPVGGVP